MHQGTCKNIGALLLVIYSRQLLVAHLQLWSVLFAVQRQTVHRNLTFNSNFLNLLGTVFVALAPKLRSWLVRCHNNAGISPYQLRALWPRHRGGKERHQVNAPPPAPHPCDISQTGGSGGLNAVRGEVRGTEAVARAWRSRMPLIKE